MLTEKDIDNLLLDINSSIDYNLYHSQNPNEQKVLIDYIESEDNHYYIYTESNITENEKKLLKLLILEKSSIYNDNTHRDNILNRLLNEDLSRVEIQGALNSLNIDKNSYLTAITIKTYNIDRIEDVFQILVNVEDIKYITKTKENLITVFIDKNFEQAIELAKLIIELIETEILEKTKIGISNSNKATNFKLSYRQTIESINVAENFKLPHNIHLYDELLLYRILYKISDEDMNYISKEIYSYGIGELDEEDIKTGLVFMSCNLNISEAARNLYIHRNTLIYRLDKIFRNTGLDLRSFEHALKFKLLLILNNYNYTILNKQ